MKKTFIAVSVILVFSIIIFAQGKGEGKTEFCLLNDIKFDDNVIRVITDKPVKYNIFKISKPPKLVMDLTNTEHNLSKKEMRIDSSVVKRIRSSQFENEPVKIARVVVDLKKMVAYKATRKGNEIILSLLSEGKKTKTVTPADKTSKESTKEEPTFEEPTRKETDETQAAEYGIVLSKTLVTLEYHEADIRDVLQIMSIRSGVNIIYGSDVTGNITISLKDVPFDQAFRTILTLKSLTYIPVGDNIIRVITPTQLTQERSQAVTFTKIFPLNYAKAEEVKTKLDSIRGIQGRRGITDVDIRTNSLIVTDTAEGIKSCEDLIKQLDVKPLQVMIEARIVDVRLDSLSQLGVNWSYSDTAEKAGAGVTVDARSGAVGSDIKTTIDGKTVSEISGKGIKSMLPVPGGGVFNFGFVTAKEMFNMTIGALITDGKAKVLSAPKVTTINNEEARLLAGEKMPFKTTTIGPGGVSQEAWSYVDVGVKLTVKPTITKGGSVMLKVHPEVSVPSAIAVAGAPPPVRTRETEVTVMIDDGDTLVIGGLIGENDIETISKVPLLGDLPILGYFFKYKEKIKSRNELLVFITPKILKE